MKRIYDRKVIQNTYDISFEYDEERQCLELLHFCIILTHRCTLKCKLCAEKTAYYKTKYHPELTFIKKEIDRYFEIVDYTMKFDVSGGEPFLRKDIGDILKHILQYKGHFGRVRINTNGTILPSKEVIEVLKLYGDNLDVLIDDYGADLSINAKNLAKLFSDNGIAYIYREQNKNALHFSGWVDFGNFEKKHTREEAKELFKRCAISSKIGFGFRLKGGIMSPCAIAIQAMEFGVLKKNEAEFLDIFDENLSLTQMRQKLKSIFELSCFDACMYCNGMCKDSKRFIPAEQLTKEEILNVRR